MVVVKVAVQIQILVPFCWSEGQEDNHWPLDLAGNFARRLPPLTKVPFWVFERTSQEDAAILRRSFTPGVDDDGKVPGLKTARSNPIPGPSSNTDSWRIYQEEESVREARWNANPNTHQQQLWDWCGIQLCSPLLQIDSMSGLGRVISALVDLRENFRVRLNSTCGTHWHVSIGPDGWRDDLVAFKKMATLLWLGEAHLEVLIHPARHRTGRHLRRITESSTLAGLRMRKRHWNIKKVHGLSDPWFQHLRARHRLSGSGNWARIAFIWKQATAEKLQSLLQVPQRGSRAKANFVFDMKKQSKGGKGTVEFRQMEGTIHPQIIEKWGIVVTSLARTAADSHNFDLFADICEGLACDGHADYHHVKFLGDVGVDYDTMNALASKETIADGEQKGVDTLFKKGAFGTNDPSFPLPYRVKEGVGSDMMHDETFFENQRYISMSDDEGGGQEGVRKQK